MRALEIAGRCRLNIVISGGTGSGKTTLMNAISRSIENGERIVTIEDAAELQLQQPHVVRLETRPPNLEGKGEINQRDLIKNALRMRPDRIIVGEVRGAEAFDMLQAMNTGHDGSICTVHSNTPRDALTRIENLVMMGTASLPPRAVRMQIASAVDLIVQIQRMRDGGRRITHVSEIVGMEGEVVTMNDVFLFEYARRRRATAASTAGGSPAASARPSATGWTISACCPPGWRRSRRDDGRGPSNLLTLVVFLLVFACIVSAIMVVRGDADTRRLESRIKSLHEVAVGPSGRAARGSRRGTSAGATGGSPLARALEKIRAIPPHPEGTPGRLADRRGGRRRRRRRRRATSARRSSARRSRPSSAWRRRCSSSASCSAGRRTATRGSSSSSSPTRWA